jgi:hypothetical protein
LTSFNVALHLRNFTLIIRLAGTKSLSYTTKMFDSACANFSRLPFYFACPPLTFQPLASKRRVAAVVVHVRNLRPTNS